nr:hypothetical protein [Candidatus Sigynarchaeota archaeon]
MPFFQCDSCLKIFEWDRVKVKKCPNCNKKCTFNEVTNYTTDNGGPGNIDPRLMKK